MCFWWVIIFILSNLFLSLNPMGSECMQVILAFTLPCIISILISSRLFLSSYMHRKLCYNSKNNLFLFIMMVEQEPKFSPIFPLHATYKFISLCIKHATTVLEAFFPLFHNVSKFVSVNEKKHHWVNYVHVVRKKIGCQKTHAWLLQENKMYL